MKKLISVLIISAFLAAALAVTATADESEKITVDLIAVEVTAPTDGATPDYSANVKSNAYYVYDELESGGFEGGVLWEEEFGEDIAPSLEHFEEGNKYSVCVLIKLYDKYKVKTFEDGSPNVKVTVNGNNAAIEWYEDADDDGVLLVNYVFTATKRADKPIADVTVSVTPPSTNEKPSYEAELGRENYTVYDVVWHDATKGERLDENDTFIGGHEYTVYVTLLADDGYVFAVNDNGMPVFSPLLNDVLATARRYGIETDGKRIVVCYDFPAIPEASTAEVTTAEQTTAEATTEATAEPTTEPTAEITQPTTYDVTTEAVTTTPEATAEPTTATPSESTAPITTAASTSTAAAEPTGSIIVDLGTKDGCSSTLGAGASLAAVLALLVTAAAVRKKKD